MRRSDRLLPALSSVALLKGLIVKRYAVPGIRLGGTSFLLHESYVPAVRFTAERCEDVALLLLETGARGEYLASPGEVAEIARILDGEGATLHVHLPTDVNFDTPENARAMVDKVRLVAERTAPLHPHSFVLHVDFPSLRKLFSVPETDHARYRWTAEALCAIAACLPHPEQLAIENLEHFLPGFWDSWIEGTRYSRCIDVGHIWKDGGDPASLLAAWLPRIRVMHLHGLEPCPIELSAERSSPLWFSGASTARFPNPGAHPRDHRSLRFMSPERIDAVLHPLWENDFAGVLCLEVFRFDDFAASHAALLRSRERYEAKA